MMKRDLKNLRVHHKNIDIMLYHYFVLSHSKPTLVLLIQLFAWWYVHSISCIFAWTAIPRALYLDSRFYDQITYVIAVKIFTFTFIQWYKTITSASIAIVLSLCIGNLLRRMFNELVLTPPLVHFNSIVASLAFF